ncbi:MARVEL domain-containing protein 2 isoform X2 [Sphaerodactylus townsendi]|nr:MARVEL domain-containing protein 2 isoform X2 [Sphaerodactylus townsendi]
MKTQSFQPKRMNEDEGDSPKQVKYQKKNKPLEIEPELLNGHIPAGHIPKPIVMPDYLAKYPIIRRDEERDRYKAVFNDQFAEYKELSAEVHAVLKKFDELDALMRKLPQQPGNTLEHDRISKVLQEYQKKKNDPTFLEKKERCEYLKNKLSHIKQKIQEYDKIMNWNS